MQFVLFLLSYFVTVLVHEFGHICAALLVGWKPLGTDLGDGRMFTVFRIGDMRLRLGVWPFGGTAQSVARNLTNFRVKQLIVTGGGPLATFGFLVLLWNVFRSPELLSPLPGWLQEMVAYLLYFQAILSVVSIFPRHVTRQGRKMPNDIRKILDTLALDEAGVKNNFASHRRYLFEFFLREHRIDEARTTLAEMAEFIGSALDTRIFWIHALLQVGRKSEAQAEIDTLSKEGVPSVTRAEVLDGIACLPIFWGHRELAGDFLGYIDEAIAEEPEKITLKGTKGSLLIEAGGLDEGIEMLEGVLNKSDAMIDKVVSEYYLALAFFKKGEQQKAHAHLKLAIGIDPKCRVRPRVAGEILGDKWASVKADDL